jgi:hypothetical protein
LFIKNTVGETPATEALMIAFLAFIALMIAFIVGCVCISMYLYGRNLAGYSENHKLVTLSQEAFVQGRSYKRRSNASEIGIGECMRRVGSISLGVVTIMILLIVMFVNAAH